MVFCFVFKAAEKKFACACSGLCNFYFSVSPSPPPATPPPFTAPKTLIGAGRGEGGVSRREPGSQGPRPRVCTVTQAAPLPESRVLSCQASGAPHSVLAAVTQASPSTCPLSGITRLEPRAPGWLAGWLALGQHLLWEIPRSLFESGS